MSFFRRLSIPRAYRDLRRFLLTRKPYELWFLLAAMVLTMLILLAFAHDSNIKPAYHENIIYAKSWPANRSEAQILAQQKIDAVAKAKKDAVIAKQQKERQAEFKKLDKALDSWGL